jgi:hypothetical protein
MDERGLFLCRASELPQTNLYQFQHEAVGVFKHNGPSLGRLMCGISPAVFASPVPDVNTKIPTQAALL